ncbi:PilX N-terminal domain-containing pilus assembly protein [Planctomycetota bacterium]
MIKTLSQNRGIVLIMVLGVLALLSVLAITFVQITRLEKNISRNYVDHTRAVMAAESGLEYAFSRINNFSGGALTSAEYDDMAYDQGATDSGMLNAGKASFQEAGLNKAVSGVVGGSYQDRGDYFILRVEDESGKLNLNDTDGKWNLDDDADADPDTDNDFQFAPQRLRMLIELLGEHLFGNPEIPTGIGASIAAEILDGRASLPGARFSSLEQVEELLVANIPTFTRADFERLKPNVTLWSWQDENVIRPTYTVELTIPDGESIPGPGDQYGVTDGGNNGGFTYQDVEDGYDSIHMYLTRDLQTKYFELEPRAPVNINIASEELITAILSPLAGWYLQEGPPSTAPRQAYRPTEWIGNRTQYWYKSEFPRMDCGVDASYQQNLIFGKMKIAGMNAGMAGELANKLYRRIHEDNPDTLEPDDATPFHTWQEFNTFLDNLIDDPLRPGSDPISGFTKYHADLVRANCNPNTRLNDFNPDAHIFQHIDKAQLTRYTTEFCFEPTGCFQISSLGMVANANNEIAARQKIYCVAELFRPYRVTTQAQFMQGYEGPSELNNYFDESKDLPTNGAGDPDAPKGYTLQSYPEPVIDLNSVPYTAPDGDRNYLDDSYYDGYLSLATWQHSRSDQGTDTYLINYNRTLKPDSAPVVAQIPPSFPGLPIPPPHPEPYGMYFDYYEDTPGPLGWFCPPPTKSNTPHLNRLTHNKDNADLSGVLYPDGVYSGRHRCPGYNALEIGDEENHQGMIGSFNFWIKPNFDVGLSNRPRLFFSMGQASWVINGHKLGLWYFPQGNATNEAAMSRHFYEIKKMPPRAMIFGWNGHWLSPGWLFDYNGVSRGTSTITHNWHGDGQPGHGLNPLYNVDGHQWTHIALSWNLYGIAGQGITSLSDLSVNGVIVTDAQSGNHSVGWVPPWPYQKIWSFHYDVINIWNDIGMISFGIKEFAYLGGDPSVMATDYSSDSTYDEVFAHRIKLSATENATFYSWGRYYNYINTANSNETACYTSPEINVQRTMKLTPDKQVSLRSVSWTLYWPMTNRDAVNSDFYIDTEGVDVNSLYPDDPVIPGGWDPILVDCALNGNWIYDNDKNLMPAFAGGSRPKNIDGSLKRIGFSKGDQFSFRVYFHLGDNTALYNAPVLDDITFCFAHGTPKILIWKPISN